MGAGLISGASLVLSELGVGRSVFLLMLSLSGIYFVAALLALIWSCRKRVRDALLSGGVDAAVGTALAVLARSWHLLASVYVVAMGLFWVADVLTGGDARVVDLALSLFVIPIAIGIDIWGQRLLKFATGESIEVVDLSGDEVREIPPAGKGRDFKTFVPMIRRLFRLALAAFVFFVMLDLWGVELSIGRIFTSHVLSIAVSLLLGFIVWEFAKARIDARVRQEMPMTGEDHDEGGGVGSRTGTLLLLLRKFILTVLIVIVSLIVLSSIGVNIGPLIAGAGVVGLAIGFGSQALVRDIIAGVFFLIDDSFRIGDYVESTGVKGMVEQISLRSIKLRHPRGMVYTIPFGNLKSITNFSRDYTITKLDIRVGFDTDLEQVRKVIKKINKALRMDEELNKTMLDDLKSQGVKEFDDSSMIVRVKFKTLPGEQFKVRKEVYRMIQSEFRAAGIDFASRNVTVFIPPGPKQAGAGGARCGRPEHAASRCGRGPRADSAGGGTEAQGGRGGKTQRLIIPELLPHPDRSALSRMKVGELPRPDLLRSMAQPTPAPPFRSALRDPSWEVSQVPRSQSHVRTTPNHHQHPSADGGLCPDPDDHRVSHQPGGSRDRPGVAPARSLRPVHRGGTALRQAPVLSYRSEGLPPERAAGAGAGEGAFYNARWEILPPCGASRIRG